jgi:hypothetical protein
LKEVILNSIDDFAMGDTAELPEGYLAMSRDAAREREAEDWSEALNRDASPLPRMPL